MKLDWKAVFGIVVTIGALWWALGDVDLGEIWAQARQGNMLLLLAAVFVATSGFVIRAMRWKVLLTPVDPHTTFRARFGAVSIGFMANNVLPARVGEFARAYAFSRMAPVSMSAAFGTLVVERLLDGLTLLGLLIVALYWPTFPGGDVLATSRLGAALDAIVIIIGVLVVGLVVFTLRPRPFVRTAERVAARLPGDFARPVVDALEAFLESLAILKRPWLLLQAVLWSIGFWLYHGVSFWLGMLAFGIRPVDSFIAALWTEAVVGFGVAVPSAPGFLGTFHAAADWALTDVYGVEAARSLAFAFGYWFGGWLPITLIGFWFAWKTGLSLGDVRRSEKEVERAVESEHPVAAQLLAAEKRDELTSRQNPAPVAGRIELSAPAKVNLHLRVLDRDPETGYHDLETLFHAIDLRDDLRIELADAGMELQVEGADVGPDRDNLVWRAAAAFAAETGLVHGLRIRLDKRIPAGAGLGGGSSDAAATLRGLNRLFGEPVPAPRLAELAMSLGADVPFFLGASTFAIGRGRGERLTPLGPPPEGWLVVAAPAVHVDTGEAYGELARGRATDGADSLPVPHPLPVTLSGAGWTDLAGSAHNDFEDVVIPAHPAIGALRDAVSATGPLLVLMSGSGSSVFGLYPTRESADEAAKVIRAGGTEAEVHVVPTLRSWPDPVLGDASPA